LAFFVSDLWQKKLECSKVFDLFETLSISLSFRFSRYHKISNTNFN